MFSRDEIHPRDSGSEDPQGSEGERWFAASGAMTGSLVVATVIALVALLLLRRRSHSGRRWLLYPTSQNNPYWKLASKNRSSRQLAKKVSKITHTGDTLGPLPLRYLVSLSKPSHQVVETDQRTAQMEKHLVDVIVPLVADSELASQASVRSTTHLCLPSFCELSTPFLAMRLLMPRCFSACAHFLSS